jgi:hypothetical protein
MSPAESTNHTLSIRPAENFRIPPIIADVGPEATRRFFEFSKSGQRTNASGVVRPEIANHQT